ncbi:MAG: hypothetical protein H8D62_00885 [Bacteroidetes bacterium]|nr:hypothetical protein [Bacteroidota bacterium]
MNILQKIISSLNKEESRFYKLLGARTNNHKERKDFLLFDYIRKNGFDYKENVIANKLHGTNKNAYYQLKNRLLSDLNKSMMLQYLEKESDISIMQNILLSRVYLRKGETTVAYWFLKKAEENALKLEHYDLLNTIYSEILKLSHEMVSIEVEAYLNKQKENKKKLDKVQEFDQVLALVMYRIKTAQNFNNSDSGISQILEEILKENKSNKELLQSPKFRLKTYQIISRILLQKHDYPALETYLIETYNSFCHEGLFNKSNHEQKLMMLTYLSNCLYKTQKHSESLAYAAQLQAAMDEYQGFLKAKFLFYYYNALVINYSKLDKEKELAILAEAKNNPIIKQLPTYSVFVYLNTALAYFDLGRYKNANKSLSQLLLHEDFLDIAPSFQWKIRLAELIIKYELGDFDSVEKRIKSIQKNYPKFLEENERESLLIKIIKRLIYCNNLQQDQALLEDIKQFLTQLTNEAADDTDVINYNLWLKTKIKED